MTLADKFKLDFLTSDAPEKARSSMESTKVSKFLDDSDRARHNATNILFLLKKLYLLDRFDEAFNEIENVYPTIFNALLGDWQKTLLTDDKKIDPDWWHRIILWYSNIRSALMWSSSVQDWNGIKKLLSFMDDNVKIDKCGLEGKKYYIALRYHFENKKQQRDNLFDEIISVRNKKYRQMIETFKSILINDKDATQKSWNATLKLWLQQDAKMDWYLAPESTFLYYFALEHGISIAIQEDQKDHIINFEKQKGKR
jgi:hypothetical protein